MRLGPEGQLKKCQNSELFDGPAERLSFVRFG